MKFLITNQYDVKHIDPKEPYMIISISDHKAEFAEMPASQNVVGLLKIHFDDVDEPCKWGNKYLLPMGSEDAIFILQAVMRNKEEVDLIVCQCGAGISRSSAVAAALGKIFNNDDTFVFNNPKYRPNMHAYRLLLDTYYKYYK